MPMIAFIGVRISWLMLARKSDLKRVAASARSMALAHRAGAQAEHAHEDHHVDRGRELQRVHGPEIGGDCAADHLAQHHEPPKLSAQPPRK